jgi:hypothetical protein
MKQYSRLNRLRRLPDSIQPRESVALEDETRHVPWPRGRAVLNAENKYKASGFPSITPFHHPIPYNNLFVQFKIQNSKFNMQFQSIITSLFVFILGVNAVWPLLGPVPPEPVRIRGYKRALPADAVVNVQ